MAYIFPVILIMLDLGATVVYALAADWRRALYFFDGLRDVLTVNNARAEQAPSRVRDAHACHRPPPAAVGHMVGREPSENQAGGQSERKTMPKHHGPCVAVRVFGEDGEGADVLAGRPGSVSSGSSPIPFRLSGDRAGQGRRRGYRPPVVWAVHR